MLGAFFAKAEMPINPGIASEIVTTVEINAKSAPDAIDAFIDQAYKDVPSIRQMKIRLDPSIRKLPVKIKMRNSTVFAVLKQISLATASRLTLDVPGFGFYMTPVTILDDAPTKKYRIPENLIRRLQLDFSSNERTFSTKRHSDTFNV